MIKVAFISSFLFFVTSFLYAQKSIELSKIKVINSEKYFIKEIQENQKKEHIYGIIIDNISNKQQNLIIKNGLANYLEITKIKSEAIKDNIILSVKSFEIFEKNIDNKRVEGNFWLTVEFFSEKENEKIALTEYTYTSSYLRSNQKFTEIIPIIENGFQKSFIYFDNWYLSNNLKTEGLAKNVKVVCIQNEIQHKDTITYHVNTKLNWTDFKGKKTGNNEFGAAIFSSFGFNATAKIINGQIVVSAQIQTYMVPKMSWVNNDAKTDYALAHEQAHFDITFLISEEFRRSLQEKTFSTVDWESEIRYLYLDYFRKLNKIQEKYDLETEHGLNIISQNEWLLKIKKKIIISNNF